MPAIPDRCDNWGVFCRYTHAGIETASKEGQYRSPQQWHALGAPPIPLNLDPIDARLIEDCVTTIDLYHHALLRAWHVYRVAEPTCLRLAAKAAGQKRGQSNGFDASLGMAYGLLSAALELPAVVRKERARRAVQSVFGNAPLVLV
jgi:hypothetical protein